VLRKVSDKLGSVLKYARLEKHLTQKQLAERLSITPHYLMSIENRQQIPSCDLLFRIIRELEISADTIFYPECRHGNTLIKKLEILLSKSDEQDIAVILATLQSLLQTKTSTGGEIFATLHK
jgi:transcriptional regulator with XRE-family HTH domain